MKVQVSEQVAILLDDGEIRDVINRNYRFGQADTVKWIAGQWKVSRAEAKKVYDAVQGLRNRNLETR